MLKVGDIVRVVGISFGEGGGKIGDIGKIVAIGDYGLFTVDLPNHLGWAASAEDLQPLKNEKVLEIINAL